MNNKEEILDFQEIIMMIDDRKVIGMMIHEVLYVDMFTRMSRKGCRFSYERIRWG